MRELESVGRHEVHVVNLALQLALHHVVKLLKKIENPQSQNLHSLIGFINQRNIKFWKEQSFKISFVSELFSLPLFSENDFNQYESFKVIPD